MASLNKSFIPKKSLYFFSKSKKDEKATIRTLTEYRKAITKTVKFHKGRMVDFVGDKVDSSVNVACERVVSVSYKKRLNKLQES